jgi:hypothetical protein
MSLESLLGIIIPSSFVVALVFERLFPARQLPKVKRWLLKGLAFFTFTGVVNAVVPALVAVVVGKHAPLHLGGLGTIGGALVGFAVSDFVGYWLHRTMHNVPWLWRWTHQMHHSAERMDLAGMSYGHPFDTVLTFTLTGLAVGLLGLSPEAGALAGLPRLRGGRLPALQHPHAALHRLPAAAPRDARPPPRPRRPRLQLREPPALGHPLRHVQQPGRLPREVRLLGRSVGEAGRDAAWPRRGRAELRTSRGETPHVAAEAPRVSWCA